jgi:molybdopterin converting factor small subunit
MSEETSFQKEEIHKGKEQDAFSQVQAQLEAEIEKEEAAFKNCKVLSGTENEEFF